MKAYTTRVGAGVFPTELLDEQANIITERGREYRTTTGRARRVGWLDIPLLRYAIMINDIDWIVMTKLDILGGLKKVKICVEYEIDGNRVKIASPNVRTLKKAKPIYMELDGWPALSLEDWKKVSEKGWEALPENVRAYVQTVENLLNRPIRIVSFGVSVGMEVIRK